MKTVELTSDLLRTGEAARRAGIGINWLYALSNRGDVKFVEVAGVRFYSIEEADRIRREREARRRK